MNPQILNYISFVCKDSPSLKSWFLWKAITRKRAVISSFLFYKSTVRTLPVTSLGALYDTPHRKFLLKLVSFENRHSLHFSTARSVSGFFTLYLGCWEAQNQIWSLILVIMFTLRVALFQVSIFSPGFLFLFYQFIWNGSVFSRRPPRFFLERNNK